VGGLLAVCAVILLRLCRVDGQGVEIVAEDFGAEILLRGEPGEAGKMFELEAVLDALEGFLDIPLKMPL
jgi:hypothetical protein